MHRSIFPPPRASDYQTVEDKWSNLFRLFSRNNNPAISICIKPFVCCGSARWLYSGGGRRWNLLEMYSGGRMLCWWCSYEYIYVCVFEREREDNISGGGWQLIRRAFHLDKGKERIKRSLALLPLFTSHIFLSPSGLSGSQKAENNQAKGSIIIISSTIKGKKRNKE